MKTILYGNVTDEMLNTAEMFGIDPTSFITNGDTTPPFTPLDTRVIPRDKMVQGEAGDLQNHWRMVMAADALILCGQNDHLLRCARNYGLATYHER